MSLTFGDIKDRVIFVDYAPGLHGTFISYIINNLIHGTKNKNNIDPGDYNYNEHGGIPSVIDQVDDLARDMAEAVLTCNNSRELDMIPADLPIVWPIQWSNTLTNKGQSLDGFRVIEIYAGPISVYRHLVNMMFNIVQPGATNPEYFIANFYRIISSCRWRRRWC